MEGGKSMKRRAEKSAPQREVGAPGAIMTGGAIKGREGEWWYCVPLVSQQSLVFDQFSELWNFVSLTGCSLVWRVFLPLAPTKPVHCTCLGSLPLTLAHRSAGFWR